MDAGSAFRKGRIVPALTVLLLAAAVAVTDIAGAIHEVAVAHVTCVQHGELVELQTASSPNSQLPDSQASARGAQSENRHQHCSLLSSRRTDQIVRPAVISCSAPVIPDVRPVVSDLGGRGALIVIYLSAPKHSPPLPVHNS